MLTNQLPELDVEERRNERRHTILIRADVELPNQTVLKAHAVDISRGGMGLQSTAELPAGQRLNVTVPLDVCGERRVMRLPGVVCYCRKQAERHFRVGLQFVNLDDDTMAFINAVCP